LNKHYFKRTFKVKGVNFFGSNSDYVVSGSDCGRIFFWEKTTQQIVQILKGDERGIVNVLEPHPIFPILATSGLDSDVKIWSPLSEEYNNLENLTEVSKKNSNFLYMLNDLTI
jgi:WD repeat-containing protein 42A